MKRTRVTAIASATAAALLVVSGCGSANAGHGLTVSGLHDKARTAQSHTTQSCPLNYNVGEAAKKIGVADPVEPAHDENAVSVETADSAGSGSALEQAAGTLVECDYQIGSDRVAVYTTGVERTPQFSALGLMMPRIGSDAQLASGALASYFDQAQKAVLGTATVTSSGTVAAVRLPVQGGGDIALVLSAGDQGHAALGADKLKTLAESLAAQANW
jgi:hypothetical protein